MPDLKWDVIHIQPTFTKYITSYWVSISIQKLKNPWCRASQIASALLQPQPSDTWLVDALHHVCVCIYICIYIYTYIYIYIYMYIYIIHKNNLTPPVSRVLIGQYLSFCSLTSPRGCNSPRKCTLVKYNKRQKAGFPIVT